MTARSIFFAALVGVSPLAVATQSPSEQEIVGSWVCTYEMINDERTITVTEHLTYSASGDYSLTGFGNILYASGEEVDTSLELLGRWKLSNDVIRIDFAEVELLSSSNDVIPMDSGQSSLDDQMKRKNWIDLQVIESGKELVVRSLDTDTSASEAPTRCQRP